MRNCPICQSEKNSLDRVLNSIELLKCCGCHFVFADVTNEQVENTNSGYNNTSTSISAYEGQQTTLDEIWFENIASKFTKRMGQGNVLDVGCGNCLLLKYFKLYKWNCHGVDSSSWSTIFSNKYGLNITQDKLEDLNLKESSYDLVVSTSTLEHILDPLAHVNEIVRLIRPNGLAYFTGIPNYGSGSVLFGLSSFYCNHPPGHINYFTAETFSGLLNSIKTMPRNVRIQSYGIPESNRIYNMLRKIANRGSVNLDADQKTNMATPDYKYYIAKQIVNLNYYLGRPFSIGETLEATLIK